MGTEQDNRGRILQAAEALFAAKGYSTTTVREILKAAHVSSPVLYYYFRSKKDLLLTLLREGQKQFLEQMSGALSIVDDFEEMLTGFAQLFFDGFETRPNHMRLIFSMFFGPQVDLPTEDLIEMKRAHHHMLLEHLARSLPGVKRDKIGFALTLFTGMLAAFALEVISEMTDGFAPGLASAIATRTVAIMYDDLPYPSAF